MYLAVTNKHKSFIVHAPTHDTHSRIELKNWNSDICSMQAMDLSKSLIDIVHNR